MRCQMAINGAPPGVRRAGLAQGPGPMLGGGVMVQGGGMMPGGGVMMQGGGMMPGGGVVMQRGGGGGQMVIANFCGRLQIGSISSLRAISAIFTF